MKYYSLLQLNKSIKKLIDGIGKSLWVTAEIAQISISNHAYIELVQKEDKQLSAKVRATIWQNNFIKLQEKLGGELHALLNPGNKILAQVTVHFHEVHGLSLQILDLELSFTLGELEAKRIATIEQLEREKLIGLQSHLQLPPVIQNIAIISSSTAAGYSDFATHLDNNAYGYRFTTKLYECIVQGENAPKSISQQIEAAASANIYDAIIVIRGGGSRLDLRAFDEYTIAKTIALSQTPIITGIGHHRDESIADMVAHIACKTPTAVAEHIINQALHYESWVDNAILEMKTLVQEKISSANESLSISRQQIAIHAWNIVTQARFPIDVLEEKINTLPQRIVDTNLDRLNRHLQLLSAYDPKNILKRGFSITLNTSKSPEISVSDEIKTITDKFELISKVTSINKRE